MYYLHSFLDNGVKIYVNSKSDSIFDIQMVINNFGSERDFEYGINELFRFMEHLIINTQNNSFNPNGFTARNFMGFLIYKNKNYTLFDSAKFLIGWFYNNNKDLLITNEEYFNNFEYKVTSLRSELENEYYYRRNYDLCKDPFYLLQSKPIYMGGRNFDFVDSNKIKESIKDIWKNINTNDIFFFLNKNDEKAIQLITTTFGSLKKTNYEYKINKLVLKKQTVKNSYIHFKCSNENLICFRLNSSHDIFKALFIIRNILNISIICEFIGGDLF